jgi:hypothetical protein
MERSKIIYPPEIFGKIKTSWSEEDFKFAIKKFRNNAPAAPTPRLYEAYRWLKNQIDTGEEEEGVINKQFTYFIELFLRILEERGADNSEIYREVLKDSAEYKYLKGLFHYDESEHEPLLIETSVTQTNTSPEIKKLSFKNILLKKNISLLDIDIKEWNRLICEHFKEFKTEDSFVKNCSAAVNNINKRTEKETYHVEIIVIYAFDTLLKYKTLSLKTKDFAMQLLNIMIDRGDIWTTLHKEYLEIIKK